MATLKSFPSGPNLWRPQGAYERGAPSPVMSHNRTVLSSAAVAMKRSPINGQAHHAAVCIPVSRVRIGLEVVWKLPAELQRRSQWTTGRDDENSVFVIIAVLPGLGTLVQKLRVRGNSLFVSTGAARTRTAHRVLCVLSGDDSPGDAGRRACRPFISNRPRE